MLKVLGGGRLANCELCHERPFSDHCGACGRRVCEACSRRPWAGLDRGGVAVKKVRCDECGQEQEAVTC